MTRYCFSDYSMRCLLIGKTCVTIPMPLFFPSLNRMRWPGITYSGWHMNRNRTDASSLVPIRPHPIIPSMTAVCRMLPICTVV